MKNRENQASYTENVVNKNCGVWNLLSFKRKRLAVGCLVDKMYDTKMQNKTKTFSQKNAKSRHIRTARALAYGNIGKRKNFSTRIYQNAIFTKLVQKIYLSVFLKITNPPSPPLFLWDITYVKKRTGECENLSWWKCGQLCSL